MLLKITKHNLKGVFWLVGWLVFVCVCVRAYEIQRLFYFILDVFFLQGFNNWISATTVTSGYDPVSSAERFLNNSAPVWYRSTVGSQWVTHSSRVSPALTEGSLWESKVKPFISFSQWLWFIPQYDTFPQTADAYNKTLLKTCRSLWLPLSLFIKSSGLDFFFFFFVAIFQRGLYILCYG